jgi:hypothetical protein
MRSANGIAVTIPSSTALRGFTEWRRLGCIASKHGLGDGVQMPFDSLFLAFSGVLNTFVGNGFLCRPKTTNSIYIAIYCCNTSVRVLDLMASRLARPESTCPVVGRSIFSEIPRYVVCLIH